MNNSITCSLKDDILEELEAAALYNALAEIAPDMASAEILRSIAEDERCHAARFQRAYFCLCGVCYEPTVTAPTLSDTYENILKGRIPAEAEDYRRYGRQFFCLNNKQLKEAYYCAHLDENTHALKIIYLLL